MKPLPFGLDVQAAWTLCPKCFLERAISWLLDRTIGRRYNLPNPEVRSTGVVRAWDRRIDTSDGLLGRGEFKQRNGFTLPSGYGRTYDNHAEIRFTTSDRDRAQR